MVFQRISWMKKLRRNWKQPERGKDQGHWISQFQDSLFLYLKTPKVSITNESLWIYISDGHFFRALHYYSKLCRKRLFKILHWLLQTLALNAAYFFVSKKWSWILISGTSVEPKSLSKPSERKPVLYCNDCDYKTTERKNLQNHIIFEQSKGSNKNGIMQCRKCGKKFRRISNCRNHELICGLIAHMKCEFCSRRFMGRVTLCSHIKKLHSDKVKPAEIEALVKQIAEKGREFKGKRFTN